MNEESQAIAQAIARVESADARFREAHDERHRARQALKVARAAHNGDVHVGADLVSGGSPRETLEAAAVAGADVVFLLGDVVGEPCFAGGITAEYPCGRWAGASPRPHPRTAHAPSGGCGEAVAQAIAEAGAIMLQLAEPGNEE